MIIYQVDIKIIDKDILTDYLDWLQSHTQEMLRFIGFEKVEILKNLDDPLALSVRYQVDSIENLEDYFNNHAQKMRAEGLRLFENKFSASRTLFKVVP